MVRGITGRRRTWFWWGLSGAVAMWLLWMTLRPNLAVATDLSPLTTSAAAQGMSVYLLIDLAGNVAVFVPLGAAFVFALGDRPPAHRLLVATLIGAGLSLTIELVQMTIPSRVTALDDWLLNTTGTAMGALLGLGLGRNQVFSEKPGFSSTENSGRRD